MLPLPLTTAKFNTSQIIFHKIHFFAVTVVHPEHRQALLSTEGLQSGSTTFYSPVDYSEP